jgi:hypothetical protein
LLSGCKKFRLQPFSMRFGASSQIHFLGKEDHKWVRKHQLQATGPQVKQIAPCW